MPFLEQFLLFKDFQTRGRSTPRRSAPDAVWTMNSAPGPARGHPGRSTCESGWRDVTASLPAIGAAAARSAARHSTKPRLTPVLPKLARRENTFRCDDAFHPPRYLGGYFLNGLLGQSCRGRTGFEGGIEPGHNDGTGASVARDGRCIFMKRMVSSREVIA
jgi:hypothetical protein